MRWLAALAVLGVVAALLLLLREESPTHAPRRSTASPRDVRTAPTLAPPPVASRSPRRTAGASRPEPAETPKRTQEKGLPLEVRLVDGRTGAPLAGGSVAGGRARGEPGEFLLRNPLECDAEATISLNVTAPRGFALLGKPVATSTLAPGVRTLRFVVPLYPVGCVHLHVVDENGNPLQDVRHVTVSLGSAVYSLPRDSTGDFLVAGLPRLPRHRLVLKGSVELADGTSDAGTCAFVWPASRDAFARLRARRFVLWIGGGAGGGLRGRGCYRRARPAPLPIRLLVRSAFGDLLDGAHVAVCAAGAGEGGAKRCVSKDGVVGLELYPGKYTATLTEPGRVVTATPFVVECGEPATYALTESLGRTVQVLAVGPEGAPVAFARIHVVQPYETPYCRVVDGTQDWIVYSDAAGIVELPGAPQGRFVVEAKLAEWSGRATVSTENDDVEVHLAAEK